MEKLTRKDYLANLADGFKCAGNVRCSIDDVEEKIKEKNWYWKDFKYNYKYFIQNKRSNDFQYSSGEDEELITAPYKGDNYRMFHNDIAYLLHVYEGGNIAIKVIGV